MTYFTYLAYFICIPLLVLAALNYWDVRRERQLPEALRTFSPWKILAVHVVIAVLYTTGWDNYLVATGVWWYDPDLVTGLVIGWVPIEEYTFFVLQTLLTGLWLLWIARRIATNSPVRALPSLRLTTVIACGLLWIGSVILLFSAWEPGTYLALELAWALPPVLLQLAFGADILWHHRRVIFWGLVPSTIYLCITDAIAIAAGTWTIDPAQSTGILLGNLPLEEILFFTLTNMLIVFGMILMLRQESSARLQDYMARFRLGNRRSDPAQ